MKNAIIALFIVAANFAYGQQYKEISLGKGIKGEAVAFFKKGNDFLLFAKGKKNMLEVHTINEQGTVTDTKSSIKVEGFLDKVMETEEKTVLFHYKQKSYSYFSEFVVIHNDGRVEQIPVKSNDNAKEIQVSFMFSGASENKEYIGIHIGHTYLKSEMFLLFSKELKLLEKVVIDKDDISGAYFGGMVSNEGDYSFLRSGSWDFETEKINVESITKEGSHKSCDVNLEGETKTDYINFVSLEGKMAVLASRKVDKEVFYDMYLQDGCGLKHTSTQKSESGRMINHVKKPLHFNGKYLFTGTTITYGETATAYFDITNLVVSENGSIKEEIMIPLRSTQLGYSNIIQSIKLGDEIIILFRSREDRDSKRMVGKTTDEGLYMTVIDEVDYTLRTEIFEKEKIQSNFYYNVTTENAFYFLYGKINNTVGIGIVSNQTGT